MQAALDPRDSEREGRGERVQMSGLQATDWCANCIFWNEAGPSSNVGMTRECRRYPPEAGIGSDVPIRMRFPLTYHTEWCGEQRPRRPV